MYWSNYFIPTLKENPVGTEAVSHKLLLRGGFIHMLTSGVYSYLPLGWKVLNRIETIITEEMDAAGANKLLLPSLHPMDLWKQTGRDEVLKDVMYEFNDNRGRKMCLGPTHEEVITDLVKGYVQSYKQLPIVLYQIQTKFRDEVRPRYGIVRASEFIMKDAYSFDRDKKGLQKNYDLMYDAYQKIFQRCGLDVIVKEADSGAMGGDMSHEFLVPAEIGEDTIQVTVNGKAQEHVAIELGHIFQLGTKYSDALKAEFIDEDGKQKPIIMGCYGIGVSRIIAAIIETHHDANGIIWPAEVSPFDVEIIAVTGQGDEGVREMAEKIYIEAKALGLDALYDDRVDSAGKKFKDADLIGIPNRITVGKRGLSEKQVEFKRRDSDKMEMIAIQDIGNRLQGLRKADV